MNYKYYILCWVSCISMVLADTMEDSSTSNVTSKTFAGLYGTKILDAIVTSATGFDLSLKDEAKNIYIFTKEDLQNKGYQSLEQALQYQPFITFVDSGFGNPSGPCLSFGIPYFGYERPACGQAGKMYRGPLCRGRGTDVLECRRRDEPPLLKPKRNF